MNKRIQKVTRNSFLSLSLLIASVNLINAQEAVDGGTLE